VSACVAYAELIADAIRGTPRSEVLAPRSGEYTAKVRGVLEGSWRGKLRKDVQSSGYVMHSLEAALWSIGRTDDFRSAVLTAANLGGDADTTAAIAGQLAGAMYGASGIPAEWLEGLAWRSKIEQAAARLFESSLR
jgi:ADP-ribosyl-[dinitrogen reductase] hydrolase